MLNFVGLLDFDTDADAVDTRLNEDFLMVVPGHRQWVQKDLGRAGSLDLWHIMSLGCLRGKVG